MVRPHSWWEFPWHLQIFLTMSQVPGTLAKGILGISNPIAILLVINLFLLVVGCFIDNISSTVILVR